MGNENREHELERDEQQEAFENPEGAEDISAAGESGDDTELDIEALKEEIAETRERMLRVAADAENFKKRMEREKEKMVKYAGENIFRELLPTVDNLGRALDEGRKEGGECEQKLEALLEGVDLINKGLLNLLEKFEVTPIDSVGQEFNPDEMDALTMEASDEVPKNHVLQEFARGYRFKDRVLRHAQVVVSSGNPS